MLHLILVVDVETDEEGDHRYLIYIHHVLLIMIQLLDIVEMNNLQVLEYKKTNMRRNHLINRFTHENK